MPDMGNAIPLQYEAARRRRVRLTPVLVGAAHFAVAFPLWVWCINRSMDRIADAVAAQFSRSPYTPPATPFLEQAGQWMIDLLMLPVSELWWPDGTPPFAFVLANSLAWGLTCWLILTLRTRGRPA
ncbi:MAG TPA: hypothetical protein VGN72_05615 [Tepidisphaeraceae bacterium]|jgi:hypothetical protein|nr:hypothetical protein [Tepidisphaeraceae bacterium]